MKLENSNPLARRTRQICILCEAMGKAVKHINYGSAGHAAVEPAAMDGVTVYIEGGDLFKIQRTLRNSTQVTYYQGLDGAYDAGKRVDINGLLKEVGRQAYCKGLPFNERWGQESMGYLIGYKESVRLMW
ncbi:MAG: hypothetical protein AAGF24_10735 [Cyanobacteria bacterium P01_H01_bin.121]